MAAMNVLNPWRLLQLAIVLFFLCGDIYWQWGMGGLASGVIGGMVAWYSTFAISRILWRSGLGPRFGIEAAPSISLLYRPPDVPPEPSQSARRLSDQP